LRIYTEQISIAKLCEGIGSPKKGQVVFV